MTVDRNLPNQQALTTFKIAVLLLHAPTNNINALRPLVPQLLAAVSQATPRTVTNIGAAP